MDHHPLGEQAEHRGVAHPRSRRQRRASCRCDTPPRRRVPSRPLGRSVRGADQPRRRGLPRDGGADRLARRVDRARRPRTGPAHHRGRALRRVPRVARVERRPTADPDRRPFGERSVLDFGDEPHDIEFGQNAEWNDHDAARTHQSLTSPLTIFDVDAATGERSVVKRTPTPNVDLPPTRRFASGRPHPTAEGADRHRPPRRHTRRRTARVPPVRLRVVRVVGAAVVLGRPLVVPRPRRRSGPSSTHTAAASSAGSGTSTASC